MPLIAPRSIAKFCKARASGFRRQGLEDLLTVLIRVSQTASRRPRPTGEADIDHFCSSFPNITCAGVLSLKFGRHAFQVIFVSIGNSDVDNFARRELTS